MHHVSHICQQNIRATIESDVCKEENFFTRKITWEQAKLKLSNKIVIDVNEI